MVAGAEGLSFRDRGSSDFPAASEGITEKGQS
jgi:hypothetical protein